MYPPSPQDPPPLESKEREEGGDLDEGVLLLPEDVLVDGRGAAQVPEGQPVERVARRAPPPPVRDGSTGSGDKAELEGGGGIGPDGLGGSTWRVGFFVRMKRMRCGPRLGRGYGTQSNFEGLSRGILFPIWRFPILS